jgi:hypothetical protein
MKQQKWDANTITEQKRRAALITRAFSGIGKAKLKTKGVQGA